MKKTPHLSTASIVFMNFVKFPSGRLFSFFFKTGILFKYKKHLGIHQNYISTTRTKRNPFPSRAYGLSKWEFVLFASFLPSLLWVYLSRMVERNIYNLRLRHLKHLNVKILDISVEKYPHIKFLTIKTICKIENWKKIE